jgi:hypothetical protein
MAADAGVARACPPTMAAEMRFCELVTHPYASVIAISFIPYRIEYIAAVI